MRVKYWQIVYERGMQCRFASTLACNLFIETALAKDDALVGSEIVPINTLKMQIIVLSINFEPEIISTGVYTTGMAEHLAAAGCDVDVVTALPYYPEWKTFAGWRRPFWKSRISQNGTRVVHCPIYVPANPTGMRRILHYLSFALSSAPVAMWKGLTKKPNAVIVVAPSLIFSVVGWLAARLGGSTSWLHIQDFEVEAAFATGLLPKGGVIGRSALTFEKWVLKRFDVVSSISKPMLDKLAEKEVPLDRIFELRNWANLSKITPLDETFQLKRELEIETEKVALYSGNLANKQGLEILPEVARQLAHKKDLTIVVCGEGPMKLPLQTMSETLTNIRFLPLQPIDRLSDLLGMADVHILPQIADAADLVLPSKLTNMLASGRPTIATTPSDSALAEEIEGAGLVVPPGDAAALAQALESLLDDPEARAEMGKVARQKALDRWDMDVILTRFRRQLEQITSNSLVAKRTSEHHGENK